MFGKKAKRIRELESKVDYLQKENTRLEELCNKQRDRLANVEPLLSRYINKEKSAYLKRSEAATKAAKTRAARKTKKAIK